MIDGVKVFRAPKNTDEIVEKTGWKKVGNFFFFDLPKNAQARQTPPIAFILSIDLGVIGVVDDCPGALKTARELFEEVTVRLEITNNQTSSFKPNAGRDDDNYDMINPVLRHGGAGTKVSPRTDRVHGHPLAEHQAMVASGSNDFVRGENC